jgi:hypothetical protein
VQYNSDIKAPTPKPTPHPSPQPTHVPTSTCKCPQSYFNLLNLQIPADTCNPSDPDVKLLVANSFKCCPYCCARNPDQSDPSFGTCCLHGLDPANPSKCSATKRRLDTHTPWLEDEDTTEVSSEAGEDLVASAGDEHVQRRLDAVFWEVSFAVFLPNGAFQQYTNAVILASSIATFIKSIGDYKISNGVYQVALTLDPNPATFHSVAVLRAPTAQPTSPFPTLSPTHRPTSSLSPTTLPSPRPVIRPSLRPSPVPSHQPSKAHVVMSHMLLTPATSLQDKAFIGLVPIIVTTLSLCGFLL